MHGVSAGHRTTHEVDHDVPAAGLSRLTRVEQQLRQRVPVDAVGREGQRRLLGQAQRRRRPPALEGQRPSVEPEAGGEPPGAVLEARLEKGKRRDLVRNVRHRKHLR